MVRKATQEVRQGILSTKMLLGQDRQRVAWRFRQTRQVGMCACEAVVPDQSVKSSGPPGARCGNHYFRADIAFL